MTILTIAMRDKHSPGGDGNITSASSPKRSEAAARGGDKGDRASVVPGM
jgi:hypothetical protein